MVAFEYGVEENERPPCSSKHHFRVLIRKIDDLSSQCSVYCGRDGGMSGAYKAEYGKLFSHCGGRTYFVQVLDYLH